MENILITEGDVTMYFFASLGLVIAVIAIVWRIGRLVIKTLRNLGRIFKKAMPIAFLISVPLYTVGLFAILTIQNPVWAIPLIAFLVGYSGILLIICKKKQKKKKQKQEQEQKTEEEPYLYW
jgi:undecaprenyl pyrophosphate phosphatase UppP